MLLGETGGVDGLLSGGVVGFVDVFLQPFCFGGRGRPYAAIYQISAHGDHHREDRRMLTMVFTIPSNPEASSFNCREAESDGFAERGRVDVRDSVLVANPSVREVKALSGNVPIGVRSVVSDKPAENKI